MIHVDLPDGPGSPLSRGLAACLSSITEVPLTDLPDLDDASAAHLLGAHKSWLAGRGSGLVPIRDPRSFQRVPAGSRAPVHSGQQHRVTLPLVRCPAFRRSGPASSGARTGCSEATA